MPRRTKITVWSRLSEDGDGYEHNHISNGWVGEFAEPVPVNQKQANMWKGQFWRGQRAYLVDSRVRYNKHVT